MSMSAVPVAVDIARGRKRGAEARARLRAVDALQRRRDGEVALRDVALARHDDDRTRTGAPGRRGAGLADGDIGNAVAVLVSDPGDRGAEAVARLRAVDAETWLGSICQSLIHGQLLSTSIPVQPASIGGR